MVPVTVFTDDVWNNLDDDAKEAVKAHGKDADWFVNYIMDDILCDYQNDQLTDSLDWAYEGFEDDINYTFGWNEDGGKED